MQLLRRTKPIDDFLPHILINTAGTTESGSLPKEAAASFVRNAAIDFASKTGLLTHKIYVDLQCGVSEYPIEALDCETIIGVKYAKYRNFETNDCGCSWSWGGVSFEFNDDLLKIYPAPTKDAEGGLEVEVVLIPNRDACELDAQFYDKWYDAILNGALAEVHAMPGQPWSSVTRADFRHRRFHEEIGRFSVRRVLEGRREPLLASPNPDFFTCRTSQRRW